MKNHVFRLQATWLMHSGFKRVVGSAWRSGDLLVNNNGFLASILDDWNVSTFGNIHKRKRRLVARIYGVQRCIAKTPMDRHIKLDVRLKKELGEVLFQEEVLWFQKSKEEWIWLRDQNTSFYHALTVVRKSRNTINALKDENKERISYRDSFRGIVQECLKKL
ncbi:hypothetical protein PTKIN_Ptkin17bG0064800 [Pterospermum kingtungense]